MGTNVRMLICLPIKSKRFFYGSKIPSLRARHILLPSIHSIVIRMGFHSTSPDLPLETNNATYCCYYYWGSLCPALIYNSSWMPWYEGTMTISHSQDQYPTQSSFFSHFTVRVARLVNVGWQDPLELAISSTGIWSWDQRSIWIVLVSTNKIRQLPLPKYGTRFGRYSFCILTYDFESSVFFL